MGRNRMDSYIGDHGRPHIELHSKNEDRRSALYLPETKDMNIGLKFDTLELTERPSYVDAKLARESITKGKADGNKNVLWLRSKFQKKLFKLGCCIFKHCGRFLFLGILFLCLGSIGLQTKTVETDIEKLWVEGDGRLQDELNYVKKILGENYGSSSEVILHTGDVLSPDGLKAHFEAVKAATTVKVHLFDTTWSFEDVCIKMDFPVVDGNFQEALENLSPCVIISPLDCFWDGSKLLGPENPLHPPFQRVKWSNLHPQRLMNEVMSMLSHTDLDLSKLYETMSRAGITSGYVEKPCLNPKDPECPVSAPNKNSTKPLNLGAILTGGCRGFASRLMHWQEDLILGGVEKNKTGSVIGVKAMQSLLQLMGARNLYDFYDQHVKTHGLRVDWSEDRAEEVLEAWHNAFTQEVYRVAEELQPSGQRILSFASSSLTSIMQQFTRVNPVKLVAGALVMLLYVCVSLLRWWECVHSQCTVGLFGVLLVCLSLTTGIGLAALVAPFNAVSLQVLPFLGLGLGVNGVINLAYEFGEITLRNTVPVELQVGECVKRTGGNVLLTSLGVTVAFLFAAIIPIPALRAFSLQAALVTLITLCGVLLVFPAILSYDLKRRHSGRLDFLCCFTGGITAALKASSAARESGEERLPRTPGQGQVATTTGRRSETSRDLESGAIELRQLGTAAYYNPANTAERGHNEEPESSSRSDTSVSGLDTSTSALDTSISGVNINTSGALQTVSAVPTRGNSPMSRRRVSPPPPYSRNLVGQDPNKAQAVTYMSQEATASHPVSATTSVMPPPRYDALPRPGDRSSVHSTDSVPVTSSQQCLTSSSGHVSWVKFCLAGKKDWFLPFLAKDVYAPQLAKTPIKVVILVGSLVLLIVGIVGTARMKDGLELTDVVPSVTLEYDYLRTHDQYFRLYNFMAVTEDLDYPRQQQLLLDYHDSFRRVDNVVKNADGSLPKFWLSYMRNWLVEMQDAFDRDRNAGFLQKDGKHSPNATEDGILGYHLIIQTDDSVYPFDMDRFENGRIIMDNGLINEAAFYSYLTAWVSMDAFAYTSSASHLSPEPPAWSLSFNEGPQKITSASPIKYAQSSFFLRDLTDTETIVSVIKEIRAICDEFSERGLPNFPRGVPFTYWEQYIHLRFYLGLGVGCMLAVVFIASAIYMCSLHMAAMILVVVGVTVVELMGLMSLRGLQLNAIPAVILILSPGITLEFAVHIALGFATSLGDRTARAQRALFHFLPPVAHGAVTTFLGILILAFSEFDFVYKYFFVSLSLLLVLGVLNGLFLFPVLLTLWGPVAEVIPADGGTVLSLPTPEPSPRPMRRRHPPSSVAGGQGSAVRYLYPKRSHRKPKIPQRVPSDISLTTITEEPSQYSSSSNCSRDMGGGCSETGGGVSDRCSSTGTPEITVKPRVVVHTSTHPVLASSSGSHAYTSSSSANSSPSSTPPLQRHVTRTQVRATFKVEVHTPYTADRCTGDCENYKRKRRRSRGEYSSRQRDKDTPPPPPSHTVTIADVDLVEEPTSQC